MKMALGKGLESLIPEKTQEIINIELSRIIPGSQQPRKRFNETPLAELASSIREKGVLQPILVRRTGDGTFRLIAGERRWRASALAGLKKIPARIREVASEGEALELAIIENIQREDLNPVETAEAFHRLMKEFNLTQEEVSLKVGKDRTSVANYLRLLKLPDEIKVLVNDGSLSMGHAKALLSVEGRPNQLEAARLVVHKGLSVRETEALTKKWSSTSPKKAQHKKTDPQIEALEQRLRVSLGTKVHILHNGKKGKIEIEYYSLDELDRLLDILTPEMG